MAYLGLKTGISHSNLCYLDVSRQDALVFLEERFSKKKYNGGFPSRALKELLQVNKEIIKIEEGSVATNSCTDHPKLYEKSQNKLMSFLPQTSVHMNSNMLFPSHHHAHALSALVQSPFNEGFILVCDGVGSKVRDFTDTETKSRDGSEENETLSLYEFQKEKLKLIYRETSEHTVSIRNGIEYPINNGIGSLYMNSANLIFQKWQDSGKVMGLSSFGRENKRFNSLTNKELNRFLVGSTVNQNVGKVKFDNLSFEDFTLYADIAYEVQKRFETNLIEIISKWIPKGENLIFAGGTALNCVLNGKLTDYKLWTPPNPGDFGIGVGAATYVALNENSFEDIKACFSSTPFLGTELGRKVFVPEGFERVLNHDHIAARLAQLLAKGEVVAVARAKSETGPRALGHRSLLAAPHLGFMKDFLNSKIKRRENFRPYGACILESRVEKFLQCKDGFLSPYMNKAIKMRTEYKEVLSDIVHYDSTTRVQTVNPVNNKELFEILELFEKITGYPILINTSLNIMGYPICEDEDDILEFCRQNEVNYLLLNGELLERKLEPNFYSVNLDYEVELFEAELAKKYHSRFDLEYLYFYYPHRINDQLVPKNNYPDEYLAYLKKLGLNPFLSNQKIKAKPWYGSLSDVELEKKMNSKIWMINLLKNLNLENKHTQIVNSKEEFLQLKLDPSEDWFIRSPYLMSGTSCRTDLDLETEDFPVIVEPYLKRAVDICCYCDPKTELIFHYVSLITHDGQYLGGRFYKESFDFEMNYKDNIPLKDIVVKQRFVASELIRLGASSGFCLDGYITEEKEVVACCDINYRRSMGELLYSLRRFLPKRGVGEFIISEKVKGDYSYDSIKKVGMIRLSPPNSTAPSVLICAENEKQLLKLKLTL